MPFYHAVSRCVRKAWLTGVDPNTGQSYEHRRDWIESRLMELAGAFAIDIAAYAVMSNHLHLVLRIDIESANCWTDREVIEHWHQVSKGTEITQKFVKGEIIESDEITALKHSIALYRSRLSDISWFMRCLNEPIARMANTPETSEHTSLKLRVKAALTGKQPEKRLPFIGNERLKQSKGIQFSLKDYLELVDETGRILRDDKRGAISASASKILTWLNISSDNWIHITSEFGFYFLHHRPYLS